MKTISIVSVVDAVGTLANGSLTGSIYLIDNNQVNGSTGEGTDILKTAVKEGDKLVWTAQPLECEAYTSISDIVIDKAYCEPKQQTYEGTDITYWTGIVKKTPKNPGNIPYSLKFKIGSRADDFATDSDIALIVEK